MSVRARFIALGLSLVLLVVPFNIASAEESPPENLVVEECDVRTLAVAIGPVVLLQRTGCFDESESVGRALASNETWLYDSDDETLCTALWWLNGTQLQWYGAPCYDEDRANDTRSEGLCSELGLHGKARADLCGEPSAMQTQSEAAQAFECLGDITNRAPSDCVDEGIDCIEYTLENLAARSHTTGSCYGIKDACPVLVDVDMLAICGISLCEFTALNCEDLLSLEECDGGDIGVEPNCVHLEICPSPTIGVVINDFEACISIAECGPGEVGVEPACVEEPEAGLCSGGDVGIYVNDFEACQTPPTLCTAPEVGVEPTCMDATQLVCPPPTIGIDGLCVDPVPIVGIVVGIVLGIIDNEGCRPGTIPYTSEDSTWCASPEEIRQDSIPGTPYPMEIDEDASSAIEDNTAIVELEELEPEVFFPTASSDSAAAMAPTCSRYRTTCNVVFIRGYDFGDYSGYGGFEVAFGFFESHDYNYHALDTYARCKSGNTDVPGAGDSGNHDTWFAKSHSAATTCSPDGAHSKDTDIRHMAYHVAWWIYDNYGTEPVDVIAHSMGGLITRYAIAMSGRDPAWPPALHVEDVVTVATPHKGFGGASFGSTGQIRQMDPDSSFMTYLRTEAQNPQGLLGTDWTLIGADEDNTVSENNARGMTAPHKIRYNQNCCGGWADGGYDHDEYFLSDNEAETTTYYWKNAEGATVYDKHAPHSVKRMYWGTVAATH